MTNKKEIMKSEKKKVYENNNIIVYEDEYGEIVKSTKYEKYFSKTLDTKEDQVKMFNVFSGSAKNVIPLKKMVGSEITFSQVYFNPYSTYSLEEKKTKQGVVVYMENEDEKIFYATSSKTVYFMLMKIFFMFGYMNTGEYESVTVKVISEKRERGEVISLQLVNVNK